MDIYIKLIDYVRPTNRNKYGPVLKPMWRRQLFPGSYSKMDVIVDVWLNVTLGDKLCADINATHATVVALELVCNVFLAS
jgi:hypothetical protein